MQMKILARFDHWKKSEPKEKGTLQTIETTHIYYINMFVVCNNLISIPKSPIVFSTRGISKIENVFRRPHSRMELLLTHLFQTQKRTSNITSGIVSLSWCCLCRQISALRDGCGSRLLSGLLRNPTCNSIMTGHDSNAWQQNHNHHFIRWSIACGVRDMRPC